jgi:hypothetical protein
MSIDPDFPHRVDNRVATIRQSKPARTSSSVSGVTRRIAEVDPKIRRFLLADRENPRYYTAVQ